jgi:predicted HNH restriction endonuclease
MERWVKRKLDAIRYKGNECKDCHLKSNGKNYSVFEFHHLDPAQKDFAWTKLRLKSIKTIYNELDKCELLCANCHRMRHRE